MGALSGCNHSDSSSPSNTTNTGDSVTIVSVTPNSAQAGVATDFVVVVDYTLARDSDGVLDIGFNTAGVNSFGLLSSLEHVVTKGSGRYTFTTTGVTPIDWSPAAFEVEVFLSEYPTPSSWTPYTSGSAQIAITGAAATPTAIDYRAPTPVSTTVSCYKAEGVEDFCVNYE